MACLGFEPVTQDGRLRRYHGAMEAVPSFMYFPCVVNEYSLSLQDRA